MPGVERWWDDLTRDRFAAILELVLNAIADDYENLDIILKTINQEYRVESGLNRWKALAAVPVSRQEVINALKELELEGFAQACSYDTETKRFWPVDFSQNKAGMLWYYVTEKGMKAVQRLPRRDSEIL
ncbi:MAG: hypothetical protein EPN47_08370 [Acidobacteria bacterium]|nr:MAG: hypothetical protein EPN47_08370 [Acidobacteriota bacterium]